MALAEIIEVKYAINLLSTFLLILSRTYSNSSSSWVWHIKKITCHLLHLCYYSYFIEGFQMKWYNRRITILFYKYMFVTYFRSQMNDYSIFEEIAYLHFMFFSSLQIKVIPEYAWSFFAAAGIFYFLFFYNITVKYYLIAIRHEC